MSRNLAAFVAGFGTSYFRNEQLRKEQERRDRADKRAEEEADARKAERERELAQDNAVTEGLTKARSMKVGQLSDDKLADTVRQNAGVDATEEEIGTATQAYRNAITGGGDQSWRNDGGVLDKSRVGITRSDIAQAEADALGAGGTRYAGQAMARNDKAGDLRIQEAQKVVMSAPMHEIAGLYAEHPDGYNIKDWGKAGDGKFYVRYQDEQGNNRYSTPYESEQHFREWTSAQLSNDPDATTKAWDRWDTKRRQGEADKRAEEQHGWAAEDQAYQERTRPIQEGILQSQATTAAAKAGVAEQEAQIGLATNQVQLANAKKQGAKLDLELDDLKLEGAAGVKKPTAKEKAEASEIQAARMRIGTLSKEDQAFINKGDVGDNAQISPRQKQIQSQLQTAMKPDPTAVAIYGTDPQLDRWAAGGKPYQATPVPPVALRKEGVTYEMPDGTLVQWDGKGLKPKRPR